MTKSTIKKALTILDLFETDQLDWTTEEIAKQLQIPSSTCYRYLKILSDMGYVVSSSEKGYTLGPKISLLDYHLRLKDPIINACRSHAEKLIEDYHGCVLINRVFRQSFICIYSLQSKDDRRVFLNPGDAIPILSGANAHVIQAFLSRHLQLKLFDANRDFFSASGRGSDFTGFKKNLLDIRRRLVCTETGAMRSDSIGIAAPLLGRRKNILGTFSFSIPIGSLSVDQEARLVERIREIGIQVSTKLDPQTDTADGINPHGLSDQTLPA